MKTRLLICAAMLICAASVQAKDLRTAVFKTIPEMHCQNCEKKIIENMRFEKGIKDISTDLKQKTVTIQYDADKTDIDKIIKGFEKINYQATPEKTTRKQENKTSEKQHVENN